MTGRAWTTRARPDTLPAMSGPEDEVQEVRKKKTWLLLAGGAVSLLLPLGGVVYIRMTENAPARQGGSAASVFDHREGNDAKINVTQQVTITQAVAVPAGGSGSLPTPGGRTESPAGSSLDFVKGGAGGGFYQDGKAAPPAPSTAPAVAAAPAPAAAPEPAPAKPAKGGKKAFFMPKLSGNKSLKGSNFSTGMPAKGGAGAGQMAVADPQSGGGGSGQDMNALLKNIPGGINNPDVQKLIQKNKKK